MLKLIIFDLDGVLLDAKDIHYNALNEALLAQAGKNFVISREEHLSKYDGLNTKAKLELLTKEKLLNPAFYEDIFKHKQLATLAEMTKIEPNFTHKNTLNTLKKDYKIVIASNSVRNTIKYALYYTQLWQYIDDYYSNEDVKNPKPSTEMYLKAMIDAGVSPKETLIIEDSYIGRQGAEQTGALVMGVNSPADVTYENIKTFIDKHEKGSKPSKWKDPKLNILIPMSGDGSRFAETGKYFFPKPLIEVHGKPMIQMVVENINIDANYIFLVKKEHCEKYNLKALLNLISPGCKIVEVDKTTEGAACTALLAKELINNDNPLLIANSDQYLEWDSGEFMYNAMGEGCHGSIVTFKATHPKWSFVKTDNNGWVTEVAEKNPISDTATVGIYLWKRGSDFVRCAEMMIRKEIRTGREFYIAPVYNEAIKVGMKIKTFNVDKMFGTGTPADLEYYLENYDRHKSI